MAAGVRPGGQVLDRESEPTPGLASRGVDQRLTGTTVVAAPVGANAWRRVGTALRRDHLAHGALIVFATVAAVWSIPRVEPAGLGPLGLASALGPVTFVALGSLLVGFAIGAVRSRSERLLASYVVAITVVFHGLGTFAYAHLRFPWAWKHVGIVDFIQRTGGVDPTIESLNAYHNWPGFFGLNALLTDTSGLSTPLSFAAWAPIFFNLAYLAALYFVFRTFTADYRLVWTGLLFFSLGNWVGQDYFAPQAVAYLFYIVVIGVLLRWFPLGRLGERGYGEEQTVAAAVIFVILAATVVTHQLTPIMLIAGVAGLVIFRGTRLKWPLLVTVMLMALWLLSFARPFFEEYAPKVMSDLANLGGRVDSGLIDYGQVDTSQRIVSMAARGTTAAVLLLAGLGFLRSFRTSIAWRSAIILSVTPCFLVAASSYGNEILFRAFLFVLPMAALFAGALWFSREPLPGSRPTIISLSVVLVVLAFGSLLAQHGNDIFTVFSDDEVAAATALYQHAPPGAGVIQLSVSYPTKFDHYENVTELSVSTFSEQAKDRFLADPAEVFAEWLAADFDTGYVLLTRSQAADVTRRGALPSEAPQAIATALRKSAEFEILYDSPDGMLFRLREAA